MNMFAFLSQNMSLALVVAGVFGLCVGSFLNVVIHRTPLIMKREWRKECAEFLSNEPDIHPKVKEHLNIVIGNDTPISLSFPPSRCPNCHHKIRAYETSRSCQHSKMLGQPASWHTVCRSPDVTMRCRFR